MNIVWSESAKRARAVIIEFIAKDNIPAALELDAYISSMADKLMEFPQLGKKGRIAGTRELVLHEHYILVYEELQDKLVILNIVHTSMQYPPLLQ